MFIDYIALKVYIDQLHLYHEIHNDHHIIVKYGASETMGEYINKWRLAHFQNASFQKFNDNESPLYCGNEWDD